jgi:hypothetical protein
MTRGRHNNETFLHLYQKYRNKADHEHATPVAAQAIHERRRGDKHDAAYNFKQILHNDYRPRTMPRRGREHRAWVASRGDRRGDSAPRDTPPVPASPRGART